MEQEMEQEKGHNTEANSVGVRPGPGNRPSAPNVEAKYIIHPDPDIEDLVPSFLQNRRNDL